MRVAVVGVGGIGRMHARHALEHPAVEEVVLVGRDTGRLEAARAGLGGARRVTTTTDVDAALRSADLAVVATSTPTHPDLARRCVAAGTASLVEKPLALSSAELEPLAAELEASGVPVSVAFHRRYDPASTALRTLVASGALGTVRTARCVDADRSPVDPAYVPGSGGIWRDMAVHDLDVLPWLLDDEVVAVTAFGAVLAQPELRDLGDHDTVTAVLQLASGALATVAVARGNGAGQDVRLEVSGSVSSAAIGLDDAAPLVRTDGGVLAHPASTHADYAARFVPAFRAELDHALAVARGEAEVLTPPSAGLAALRLAEAAETSVRTGTTVHLREDHR